MCAAGTLAVCVAVPLGCLAGALILGGALVVPLCCVLAPLACCLPCALCCCPPTQVEERRTRTVYTRRPVFFTPYGPFAASPSPYASGMYGVDEGEVLIVNSTVFTSGTRSRAEQRAGGNTTGGVTQRRPGVVITELPDDPPAQEQEGQGVQQDVAGSEKPKQA